jgi:cytochrome c553
MRAAFTHEDRAGAAAVVAVAVALTGAGFAAPAAAGIEEGRAKAEACFACHGPGGNSADPSYPSIAAQPRQFIVSALFQFREGKRKNELMSPMAAGLSNADMNDLAAFFSAQRAVPTGVKTTAENAAAGPRISAQNNCTACHGASLMGQQHIPRIAGQQAAYLRDQLRSFKASTRADMDGVMTSAAQALSLHDIDVLADYLAGLQPAP